MPRSEPDDEFRPVHEHPVSGELLVKIIEAIRALRGRVDDLERDVVALEYKED